jgi:hypothetical protein
MLKEYIKAKYGKEKTVQLISFLNQHKEILE